MGVAGGYPEMELGAMCSAWELLGQIACRGGGGPNRLEM